MSPTWQLLTVVATEVEALIDIVQRVYRHCMYVPLIHLIYVSIKNFDTGIVKLILHERVELLLLQ